MLLLIQGLLYYIRITIFMMFDVTKSAVKTKQILTRSQPEQQPSAGGAHLLRLPHKRAGTFFVDVRLVSVETD